MDGLKGELDAFVYEPTPAPELFYPPEPPRPSDRYFEIEAYGGEKGEHLNITYEAKTISSFDGTRLKIHRFVPDLTKVTSAPVNASALPTVAVISPYFAYPTLVKGSPDPRSGYGIWLDHFVERGYIYALAEVRGTATSEGCIDLAGPAEQRDTKAIVEALAALPMSNGKVGLMGMSYDGLTTIEAAAMKPKGLAAIIPVAPVTDWYHVQGKGGAKYRDWTPFTPYGYNFQIGQAVDRQMGGDDQRCAVENQVGADDPTGDYNDWMKARDLRAAAKTAVTPMYYAHGLVDLNARPDHIAPWFNDYAGPKMGFFYQNYHVFPGAAADGFRDDYFLANVIMWLDEYVKGEDKARGALNGTVDVQDSLGRWRRVDAWPPREPLSRVFHLAPEKLVPTAPAAATATWNSMGNDDGGPLGYRSSNVHRSTSGERLAYESEPLAAELHYAGRPSVTVSVETTAPNTYVVVRLYDILPDGSWVLINRGVHSLRHREGVDKPQPVQPATRYTVTAEMQPHDYAFRPGHRVGLTISSSDDSYILPLGNSALNTIHYGGEGSRLVLPEDPIDAAQLFAITWGAGQPGWMGPHAWGGI